MPNEKHWHKGNGKTYSNNNWKWQTFYIIKRFYPKKKEYLFNKFTPFVRNGIFALSDFEDTTKNEDEDDSPNAAFLKFIESNGGYLKRLWMTPVQISFFQKGYRH